MPVRAKFACGGRESYDDVRGNCQVAHQNRKQFAYKRGVNKFSRQLLNSHLTRHEPRPVADSDKTYTYMVLKWY